MMEKNTVEVVIDGKIYLLSGSESDSYLHEVAGYLNSKILQFKREVKNYNKLEDSLKALLLEINICDDLFLEQEKLQKLRKQLDKEESESYSAKHDLVNTQMKLEAALRQLEETQKKYQDLMMEKARLEAVMKSREENHSSQKHRGQG